MQNVFLSWKKMLPALALAILFPTLQQAQTNDPMFDRMEQLFQRLQEQMRNGIAFDTTFQGGQLQFSPDSSSYFYYRVDTSFNGLGDSQFFRFSPFDNPGQGGFPDMGDMFDRFFKGGDPFQPQRPGYGDFPADDGQKESGEDDLLPEERLRLQQDQAEPNQKTPQQPEKPAKPKVKTIRI